MTKNFKWWVAHFEESLCAALFSVMAIITFGNVITRYFLKYSFAFTEEIVVSFFVWLTLLGTAIAFREQSHLGFTFLVERLPRKFQRGLLWLSAGLGAVLFLFLIYFSILQLGDEIALEITSSGIGVPSGGTRSACRFSAFWSSSESSKVPDGFQKGWGKADGFRNLSFRPVLPATFIGIPIAVSVGITALLFLWVYNLGIQVLSPNFFANIAKFPLLAIPFFILAGFIMDRVGLSRRLVNLLYLLIGPVPGGLGLVTVCGCVLFGAISGTGPADTAAIGAVMIPAMVKKGYDKGFAAALVASAATTDVLIPPSVAFVVYGVITETSIGVFSPPVLFPV